VNERLHRIGRNEAVFREVNERIEQVTESLHATSEVLGILCECGDDSCTAQIDVSVAEYERVRSDSALFFVCPGHEIPDVEDVVEHHDEYDVVRKKPGEAEEVAEALDRREN